MLFNAPQRIKPATAIVVSIALFVVLDVSILILNYHIARQIDDDSLAINLAGRQRMLSEQMARQVLEMRLLPEGSVRREILRKSFSNSQKLFSDTLNAFVSGGEVAGSDSNLAYLRARTDAETHAVLQRVQIVWRLYRDELAVIENSPPPTIIQLSNADKQLTAVNEFTTVLEHQARRKARLLRWVQSASVIIVLLNFAFILWHVRQRYRRVTNSNVMLQDLVDKMSTAVLLFNNSAQTHYANKAAGLLFGIPAQELIGKTRPELLHQLDDSIFGLRANGEKFFVHVEQRELVFEGTPVQIVTVTEITQTENDIHWRHLAYHDTLTGIPNRLLFEHRISNILSTAHRHGDIVALLTIDLDNFKEINDCYGHIAGDEVLRVVAQRFREHVRFEDLIARLGGDEFVIVVTGFKSQGIAYQTIKTLCGILLQCIQEPVTTLYGEIAARGSIGVSFYPVDGEELRDVLHQSDAAMYRAKASGGGCEFLRQAG